MLAGNHADTANYLGDMEEDLSPSLNWPSVACKDSEPTSLPLTFRLLASTNKYEHRRNRLQFRQCSSEFVKILLT